MRTIIEIPDDFESIPREHLKIIKKYTINPKDFEFIEWIKHVRYLAKNKINQTFVTGG